MKMTVGSREIDKIYKRRNRYEIPDWQRTKVWDKAQKQHLIDTILRGWHLPKFYFRKIADDHFEVVDGQQRLNAIFEFCGNTLPLSNKTAEEFGGIARIAYSRPLYTTPFFITNTTFCML
jgi:uncharacterized protein with ParB-like and HNH nuclease domain